jgi:hypothetical protein
LFPSKNYLITKNKYSYDIIQTYTIKKERKLENKTETESFEKLKNNK